MFLLFTEIYSTKTGAQRMMMVKKGSFVGWKIYHSSFWLLLAAIRAPPFGFARVWMRTIPIFLNSCTNTHTATPGVVFTLPLAHTIIRCRVVIVASPTTGLNLGYACFQKVSGLQQDTQEVLLGSYFLNFFSLIQLAIVRMVSWWKWFNPRK